MSGPHFRSYHLLFDEQAAEIYATTDELAERVRKIGGKTIHSISEIAKLQTIKDNNKEFVSAQEMLIELMPDTKLTIKAMRAAHEVVDKHDDIATASILENFIDAAEKRHWFLFEMSRSGDGSGHWGATALRSAKSFAAGRVTIKEGPVRKNRPWFISVFSSSATRT